VEALHTIGHRRQGHSELTHDGAHDERGGHGHDERCVKSAIVIFAMLWSSPTLSARQSAV
jgi:hypothetical protein